MNSKQGKKKQQIKGDHDNADDNEKLLQDADRDLHANFAEQQKESQHVEEQHGNNAGGDKQRRRRFHRAVVTTTADRRESRHRHQQQQPPLLQPAHGNRFRSPSPVTAPTESPEPAPGSSTGAETPPPVTLKQWGHSKQHYDVHSNRWYRRNESKRARERKKTVENRTEAILLNRSQQQPEVAGQVFERRHTHHPAAPPRVNMKPHASMVSNKSIRFDDGPAAVSFSSAVSSRQPTPMAKAQINRKATGFVRRRENEGAFSMKIRAVGFDVEKELGNDGHEPDSPRHLIFNRRRRLTPPRPLAGMPIFPYANVKFGVDELLEDGGLDIANTHRRSSISPRMVTMVSTNPLLSAKRHKTGSPKGSANGSPHGSPTGSTTGSMLSGSLVVLTRDNSGVAGYASSSWGGTSVSTASGGGATTVQPQSNIKKFLFCGQEGSCCNHHADSGREEEIRLPSASVTSGLPSNSPSGLPGGSYAMHSVTTNIPADFKSRGSCCCCCGHIEKANSKAIYFKPPLVTAPDPTPKSPREKLGRAKIQSPFSVSELFEAFEKALDSSSASSPSSSGNLSNIASSTRVAEHDDDAAAFTSSEKETSTSSSSSSSSSSSTSSENSSESQDNADEPDVKASPSERTSEGAPESTARRKKRRRKRSTSSTIIQQQNKLMPPPNRQHLTRRRSGLWTVDMHEGRIVAAGQGGSGPLIPGPLDEHARLLLPSSGWKLQLPQNPLMSSGKGYSPFIDDKDYLADLPHEDMASGISSRATRRNSSYATGSSCDDPVLRGTTAPPMKPTISLEDLRAVKYKVWAQKLGPMYIEGGQWPPSEYVASMLLHDAGDDPQRAQTLRRVRASHHRNSQTGYPARLLNVPPNGGRLRRNSLILASARSEYSGGGASGADPPHVIPKFPDDVISPTAIPKKHHSSLWSRKAAGDGNKIFQVWDRQAQIINKMGREQFSSEVWDMITTKGVPFRVLAVSPANKVAKNPQAFHHSSSSASSSSKLQRGLSSSSSSQGRRSVLFTWEPVGLAFDLRTCGCKIFRVEPAIQPLTSTPPPLEMEQSFLLKWMRKIPKGNICLRANAIATDEVIRSTTATTKGSSRRHLHQHPNQQAMPSTRNRNWLLEDVVSPTIYSDDGGGQGGFDDGGEHISSMLAARRVIELRQQQIRQQSRAIPLGSNAKGNVEWPTYARDFAVDVVCEIHVGRQVIKDLFSGIAVKDGETAVVGGVKKQSPAKKRAQQKEGSSISSTSSSYSMSVNNNNSQLDAPTDYCAAVWSTNSYDPLICCFDSAETMQDFISFIVFLQFAQGLAVARILEWRK